MATMSEDPGAETSGHSTTLNGKVDEIEDDGLGDHERSDDLVERLQEELRRTREEKDTLSQQYKTLLGKLSTMRTTLGDKLKEDAEELDRREIQIQQLTSENADMKGTIEALQSEVVQSSHFAERASKDLESMRARILEDSNHESLTHERELREARHEIERYRLEREGMERSLEQERLAAEDFRQELEECRRSLEAGRTQQKHDADALKLEQQRLSNLQSVLEEFQSDRDRDLKAAIADSEARTLQLTQSLAEYKHKAHTAELALEKVSTDNAKTTELQQELKEKTLLIGKLRHEAVTLNEYLMEALRRLRKDSSDTNVDRRLVNNVLLSFIATARGDPKRYEMLSLLASILQWSEAEREKAGLQRASSSGGWLSRSTPSPRAKELSLEKSDETESFSQMWVEFLMKESGQAAHSPSPSPTAARAHKPLAVHPLPTSPTLHPGANRLPSTGSADSAL